MQPKHSVTGRSLKSALAGDPLQDCPVYSETDLAFLESRDAPSLRSVTTRRWKYVATTRPELYDLELDPQERENLADTLPATVQELATLLRDMQGKLPGANREQRQFDCI